jgi:hypothetical protein
VFVASGGQAIPTPAIAATVPATDPPQESPRPVVKGRLICDVTSPGAPVTPRPKRGSQQPAKSCTPWEVFIAGSLGLDLPPSTAPATRVASDGSILTAHTRTCTPGGLETGWFGVQTVEDAAQQAYRDLQSKLLPAPAPRFAPPIDKMIVNFETWFGIEPVEPVTVTASVPGFTATATATPIAIELDVNSIVDVAAAHIRCTPFGSIEFNTGGCAWTPLYPSVPKVTGTDDLKYPATIAIVWQVTWSGTGGAGGSYDDVTTVTPLQITVMEIQVF